MEIMKCHRFLYITITLSLFATSCTEQQSSDPPTQNKVDTVSQPPSGGAPGFETNCHDSIDNDRDGFSDKLDPDCDSASVAPTLPDVPAIPPRQFPPTKKPSSTGGGSQGSERPARTGNPDNDKAGPPCKNNITELNPRSTLTCPGFLYGVATTQGDPDLVRINQVTGTLNVVGSLGLAALTGGTTERIAGLDFDPQGGLYLLAVINRGGSISLEKFSVDCNDATVSENDSLYTGGSGTTADGFTIDSTGVAFSLLKSNFDNDNDNEVRLIKFGYEEDIDQTATFITPDITTIDPQAPLGLDAVGFPGTNTLYSADDDNVCSINKTNAATICDPYAGFSNFPGGFNLGDFQAVDQDFNTKISYALVTNSDTSSTHLAQINFVIRVVTNISLLDREVLAIAVNQSFEECDPSSLMPGTVCNDTCLIEESNCNDDIDNDMNGATDGNDPACPRVPVVSNP